LANRETWNRSDELRLVRERQVYTADNTEVVPPKPFEPGQAECLPYRCPFKPFAPVTRALPSASSEVPVRLGPPVAPAPLRLEASMPS
jgi:hypothetical protein